MEEWLEKFQKQWTRFWRTAVIITSLLSTIAVLMSSIVFFDVPAEEPVARSFQQVPIHTEQGGAEMHVATGGKIEIETGGELELQSGSTFDIQAGAGSTFDTLAVSAATAVGTATPVLVVDSLGVSNILEVRDAATPVWTLNNGGNVVAAGGQTFNNWAIVTAPTAIATATPGVVINSLGVSNILEVRDGGTSAFAVEDGGNTVSNFGAAVVAPTAQATAVAALSVNNLGVAKAFEVSDAGTASFSVLNGGGVVQPLELEHLGSQESHITLAITFTAAAGGSGTVATITDGEIWLVRRVIINVTTDFDATGDDVTLDIGDGNDADGMLDLADADLQAAATDYTGAQAGWQGLDGATPLGVYIIGGPQLYAPSGADETIDWLLDETSGETITAGAATIHVFYTRFQ